MNKYQIKNKIKDIQDLANQISNGYLENIANIPNSKERYLKYIKEQLKPLTKQINKLEDELLAEEI
jgi:hypothetical protein